MSGFFLPAHTRVRNPKPDCSHPKLTSYGSPGLALSDEDCRDDGHGDDDGDEVDENHNTHYDHVHRHDHEHGHDHEVRSTNSPARFRPLANAVLCSKHGSKRMVSTYN